MRLLEDLATLPVWQLISLTGYFTVLGALSVLALHRWAMIACVRSERRAPPAVPVGASEVELPTVTVQLPLYNEANVAGRLLEAVAALDYPRDRLEIQILDDSTDDTRLLVETRATELVERGLDVVVLHREDRAGYKAGALAAGLERARGEVIALFDADFLPTPDFLKRLVVELADEGVGMVQARWDHINENASLLTRVQALGLDGHFLVEHVARQHCGLFFNFNGTAGIWRREAIESAGGWCSDTVTEDLDLSYRAQLAGWRFVYRADVAVPAELPGDMTAFAAQQGRWTRGSAQTARKLLGSIMRATLPAAVKREAVVHLSCGVAYPLLLALAVFTLPVLALRWRLQASPALATALVVADLLILLLATGAVVAFYGFSQVARGRGFLASLPRTLALMGVGMGLAPANTVAWFQGVCRRGGEFVRTPKSGREVAVIRYRPRGSLGPAALNLALAAAFVWASVGCVTAGLLSPLPFALLFAWGFLYVGVEAISGGGADVRSSGEDSLSAVSHGASDLLASGASACER